MRQLAKAIFVAGVLSVVAAASAASGATLNPLGQAAAYTQAGMYQPAVEALKQFEPKSSLDSAKLNVAIGRIYLELGQPKKGRYYFLEALRESSAYPEAKLGLADAEIRLGDISEAKETLKEAAKLGADPMEAQFLWAQIDELGGNQTAGDSRLKQLAIKNPTKDMPVVYWAKLKLIRGDLDGAISYLKIQRKRFEGSAAINEALGDALAAKGQITEAMASEKFAQQIYLKQGRTQQAMAVQLKLSRMSALAENTAHVKNVAPVQPAPKAARPSEGETSVLNPKVSGETTPPLLSRRGVTNKDIRNMPEYARPGIPAFYEMFPFPTGTQITGGSGVVIDGGRKVVTNRHVIEQGKDFAVRNGLGDVSKARVVFRSDTDDLAVLELDTPFPKDRAVQNEFFQRAKPGSSTVVMGYPLWYVLGSSTPSLSNGVVAKGTGINEDPTTFQLTAKINKGNSGGPVFDMYGNLIGITMGKLDNEEIRKTDGLAPEDINFAIHVDRLNKPLNMKLTSVGGKDRPMLKPEDIYQMMVGKVVIVAVALN